MPNEQDAFSWLNSQNLIAQAKRSEIGLTGNYPKTQQAIDAEYVSENTIGGRLGQAIQDTQMDIVEERGLFEDEPFQPNTEGAPVPFEQPVQETDINSQLGRLNQSLSIPDAPPVNTSLPVTQPTIEEQPSELPPPPQPTEQVSQPFERPSYLDGTMDFDEMDRISQGANRTVANESSEEEFVRMRSNPKSIPGFPADFNFTGGYADLFSDQPGVSGQNFGDKSDWKTVLTAEGRLQQRIRFGSARRFIEPGTPIGGDEFEVRGRGRSNAYVRSKPNSKKAQFGRDPYADDTYYRIGDRTVIDGKWAVWAGKNYGWQTYESALELEKKGRLRNHAQEFNNAFRKLGIEPSELDRVEDIINKEPDILEKIIKTIPGPHAAIPSKEVVAQYLDIDPRVLDALVLTGALSLRAFGVTGAGTLSNSKTPRFSIDAESARTFRGLRIP